MAVDQPSKPSGGACSRWFFGTNVTVAILLAAILVVGVNWIGHEYNTREDVSGGFGGGKLSDRTRKILGGVQGDMRITTVYTSEAPETDQDKFLPKLQDLCEEIEQASGKITVQHLRTDEQTAELRDRVQEKFGTAAKEYRDAVELARTVWDELKQKLEPRRAQVRGMLAGDTWLSQFTPLANRDSELEQDLMDIEQTRAEVRDLIEGQGIPRYKEANDKIKQLNDRVKQHLEESQRFIEQIDALVKVLGNPDSPFAVKTREQAKELARLTEELQNTVGKPDDETVPDDPKPAMQDYAKSANALATWLFDEVARMNAFVTENPAIQVHPKWTIQVQQHVLIVTDVPIPALLSSVADDLSSKGQQIRQILTEDVPKDKLQVYVRNLRTHAAQRARDLRLVSQRWLDLLEEGGKIDQKSKDFVAEGGEGKLYGDVLARIDEVGKKITALPELELDTIAERLQKDNIVVVESADDVQVVSFDEIWPPADPTRSFAAADGEQRRVFDGDSAIAGALLSLQNKKPFGTVIFVAFEISPPPQMRQFQQGGNRTGPIPLEQLGELKKRLEKANFKVKDWNLGAEGEEAAKPEPEEGTQAIYVFLPPAPPQQNFMMQQQAPQKEFGEAEIAQLKQILASGGQGIFFGVWQISSRNPFAPPPPPYAFNGLLQEDWGIKVDYESRLLRGVADTRNVGRYNLDAEALSHMQLSSFNQNQPIGAPLRARRMLMDNVCPVEAEKAADKPNVKITEVLAVDASERDVWAESNEGIERIGSALSSGIDSFEKNPRTSKEPPFSVILAAENTETKSRILVMGNSYSFMDYHVTRRVPRLEGDRSKLILAEPPTENLDIMVNAAYWLSDHKDLIAAGPADVPIVPSMEVKAQNTLWLVSIGWALAALVAGGAVMIIRRK